MNLAPHIRPIVVTLLLALHASACPNNEPPQATGSETGVTDDEVKAYYLSHLNEFSTPEVVRATHILLRTRTDEGPMEAAEKQAQYEKAQALLKRIRDGEDFTKIRTENSQDPGPGEYVFQRGVMVPEFEKAAFSLETNQVSEIVTTVFGFHIIKVLEKTPSKTKPLAEVTPQIRALLEKERQIAPRTSDSQTGVDHSNTLKATGTAFFISTNGFAVTCAHVIVEAAQIRVLTTSGAVPARLVRIDEANDLALIKAEGSYPVLPIVPSRTIRLGATVATIGFPNVGLQGFSPKLAKGEIASLSGVADDARYFQISVPIQPGNSGGPLVDERGNVVGVVSSKLSTLEALRTTGSIPENVNYAIKSSFLLGFLESVPEALQALQDPQTRSQGFEEVVKHAEQAAVLVLVY